MNIYIKLIMEINLFKKIYNFLNHIGINLIKIFNLIYIFKFLKDLSSFKKKGGNNNKAIKLLERIHPNMKQFEVEMLAGMYTTKELKQLAEDHNIESKL